MMWSTLLRRWGSLITAVLILVGGALIAGSFIGRQRSSTMLPMPPVAPRPSPTWGPLPTRAPGAPAVILPNVSDLWQLHRAVLRRDVESAQAIWETEIVPLMQEVLSSTEDVGPAPSSTPEIATFIAAAQAAGARLALMQDDTDSAESRTWAALRFAPQDPQVWSLLGISLRKSGEFKAAEQAFAIAQTLAPAWAPELFEDRWRAALRAKDIAAIVILAEDYSLRYPESTLAAYYRAEALLATYQPLAAIEALIPSVQEPPSAPALLWYTLGRAYLARGGFREAATALEVAASKIAQGDSSLDLVVDDQILALSIHLGKAYFGMDRCAEAEGIFRRLSTDHPEFEGWLERSIICQTPTPTLTPWMPVMTPYP